MGAWTDDELDAIGAAEELDLAPARSDGTLRRPVTMWVVRAGDDLPVRSVNGRGSRWFRSGDSNDPIDAADEAKYGRRYPTIVPAIVAPDARAATLKLIPR